MCGIAGIVGQLNGNHHVGGVARAMARPLVHRGPDDSGYWHDESAPIALAHRRLAIIDLSAEGRQPMVSASGRYVIALNGEIYNFCQLRHDLVAMGQAFRGHSDTEVLLTAIDVMGIDAALEQAVGMFAIALWDREARVLRLVRDRLGEKPLYWAQVGRAIVFGSELRALSAVPGVSFQLDRGSIALLLRHNYIPAPWSIYDNVFKVAPGTVLPIACVDGTARVGSTRQYWSVRETVLRGAANQFTGSYDDAIDGLAQRLETTVRGQMTADVPLGAFLSGGVDSSTVVAMMQSVSSRRVETFSIGFHEEGYNEARHAKAVAEHLGTHHTELYLTAREALQVVSEMPQIYDEPFADSSQIPTLLVSRMARKHVTVALTGDGGDEVFGGYNRYIWARDLWRLLAMTPVGMRRAVASALQSVGVAQWNRLAAVLYRFVPQRLRYPIPGDRVHKLADLISVQDAASLYHRMQSHWKDPGQVVIGGVEPATLLSQKRGLRTSAEFIEYMMELDLQTYLPDDILVKVDRAAMSASLETRVPLLDHRIIEFAASLPLQFKSNGRIGKRVLRGLLHRHVPIELVDRPKVGFAMPIADWLRGPLREWAEELLSVRQLESCGIFSSEPIRLAWEQHLSGARSCAYQLWDVLMFQAWLHAQKAPQVASFDSAVLERGPAV